MKKPASLSKSFLRLAVLLGISAVSVFGFIFLANRSDAAKQDLSRAQKELELYQAGIWRLKQMDRGDLSRQLAELKARFPSAENLTAFIKGLTDLARSHDLAIVSIVPSEKASFQEEKSGVLSGLNRVPIEMRLGGTYKGLAAFLSQLSDLKQGVIKAERFRLGKGETSSGNLALSLTVSVCVNKTSGEDILKGPISSASPLQRRGGKSRVKEIARDPFQKAVEAAAVAQPTIKTGTIGLEGIIYDPAAPLVLIHGETKGVGDLVGEMKILEILPDSVLFQRGREQVRVRLREELK